MQTHTVSLRFGHLACEFENPPLSPILWNHPAVEGKGLFTRHLVLHQERMSESLCLPSGIQTLRPPCRYTDSDLRLWGGACALEKKSKGGSLTWWVKRRLEYALLPLTLLVSVPGKGWLPTLPATLVNNICLPYFDAEEH